MIIKNFRYIKLALLFPYAAIAIWGGYIYFLYHSSDTPAMIIPLIGLLIMFKKILGLGEVIMKRELYRRVAKLPISKSNIMNWNINKNVGISFVDFEKNTFWFCGTQTDFEAHVLSMKNISYKEFYDHIVFTDIVSNNRYIVYKYTN
ncbi:MAG: hypothetical protein Q4D53_00455 [Leptotrichiaceae bacterium]|nr:hypothetical protein [Leptotrichiaceae bacterium]